jgi:2'-hydroxyisoflavone reductase
MKLLLIGGGVFLGAAVLHSALARGHAVTVFNRGRSRTSWPAGVEVLVGDRSADLGLLEGRSFDAVVDTCGYAPADVRASALALRDAASCYCFVSSISAYASFAHAPLRESDTLASFAGIAASDRDLAHYGPQKAACEAAVLAAFGERALLVRPGLIVGPGDPTGRFAYWPWRAMAGGEMLVPAAPAHEPLQFIDVRDLGDWMVRLLEAGGRGSFNATGPAGAANCSWPTLIEACTSEAAGRGAPPLRVMPVGEAFLGEQGVAPWRELPLWLPSNDADYTGFSRSDIARAESNGLTTRPLAETIAAILDEGVPAEDDARRQGKLERSREAHLLRQWQELETRRAA